MGFSKHVRLEIIISSMKNLINDFFSSYFTAVEGIFSISYLYSMYMFRPGMNLILTTVKWGQFIRSLSGQRRKREISTNQSTVFAPLKGLQPIRSPLSEIFSNNNEIFSDCLRLAGWTAGRWWTEREMSGGEVILPRPMRAQWCRRSTNESKARR